MVIVTKTRKPGKAAEPSKVCAEISAREVRVSVMMELCQCVLDGKGMPDKWQTNVLVLIFTRKCDVRICTAYRGVELLEHAIKIDRRVLERIRKSVNVHAMQFDFMLGRGTTENAKKIIIWF